MVESLVALAPATLAAREDLRKATRVATLGKRGDISYELRAGDSNLWVVGQYDGADLIAIRSGVGAIIESPPALERASGAYVCDWRTAVGAVRLKISFPKG